MAWYDKYYNKITLNGQYYYCVADDKVYPAASKCIHPQRRHIVQWFEYIYKDNKYQRVYKKDTRYRKYVHLSPQDVKLKYPEYFFQN